MNLRTTGNDTHSPVFIGGFGSSTLDEYAILYGLLMKDVLFINVCCHKSSSVTVSRVFEFIIITLSTSFVSASVCNCIVLWQHVNKLCH